MKKCAIAVFVKTPGFSPIKTRLGKVIGRELAERFHSVSALAVQAVILTVARQLDGLLEPYWAVAEQEALEPVQWKGFPTLFQGKGSLGQRLDHVYRELRIHYDAVIFVGADSPHLSPSHLTDTIQRLESDAEFVLGRAQDGGYWLFGGRCALPSELWTTVPYSVPETAQVFASLLRPLGRLEELPVLLDVDTVNELPELLRELDGNDNLLIEQKALQAFLRNELGI